MSERKVLLAVSFGTSYNENREASIGAIEAELAAAFPDWEIRRAFTSRRIIDCLQKRDGLRIDNMREALARAAADGVRTLAVLPTHLMAGFEYTALARELEAAAPHFARTALARPLLSEEADFAAVADAAAGMLENCGSCGKRTALCLMGHGTEARANGVYERLQQVLWERGHADCFVGTVEAGPSLEEMMARMEAAGPYRKAVVRPLMVVAGDHANHDMAGDGPQSWKRRMEAAGYEVSCVIRGLGQEEAIRQIYTAHARAAIDALGPAGIEKTAL